MGENYDNLERGWFIMKTKRWMAVITFYKYPPIEKQLENLNNGIYRFFLQYKYYSAVGPGSFWQALADISIFKQTENSSLFQPRDPE